MSTLVHACVVRINIGHRDQDNLALIQFQINGGQCLPSFLTAGSCAEYHFKPLRQLLQMHCLETRVSQFEFGDRNVLFATLQRNTHVVAHYFDLKITSYFNKVMGALFGVKRLCLICLPVV